MLPASDPALKLGSCLTEEQNANKVDVTKDRQELAIFAFTIVTVVFLPLSAVSSIFGMNTVDSKQLFHFLSARGRFWKNRDRCSHPRFAQSPPSSYLPPRAERN